MRSIFSKSIMAAAVMAAAALVPTSANAETTLKVPFSFTAAGKTLPAGLYAVREDEGGGYVTLTSKETLKSTNWVLGPAEPNPNPNAQISLKFDHAGDSYALRSIQIGSKITGRLDKEMAAHEREVSLTSGGR